MFNINTSSAILDNSLPVPEEFMICRHHGDFRNLSSLELDDIMGRMRADIASADNRRRKIARQGSSEENTEELSKIRREISTLWADLEKISKYSKKPIFDYSSASAEIIPTPSDPVRAIACSKGEAGGSTEVSIGDQSVASHASSASKRSYESTSDGEDTDRGFLIVQRKKNGKSQKNLSNNQIQSNVNNVNNSNSENMEVTETKIKKPNVPPIFLEPPNNWQMLLTRISSFASSLKNKMTGRFMKLEVDSVTEFRNVQAYLIQEKARFKTHILDEDRPLKAVIRGLPFNTDVQAIQFALINEGFADVTVTKMYRGPVTQKEYMPLFHLSTPNTPNADSIFGLDYLMGTQIKVEEYKGKKGPSQCYNCNGFFHSAAACRLPPSCLKCAKAHRYQECTKRPDEPCKCVNCGGPHPANFRDCPKFPQSTTPKPKSNNSKKTGSNANSQSRAFSTRKVDGTQVWANVAHGCSGGSSPTLNSTPPKTSVPAGAFSVTEFIQNIIAFEEKYTSKVVLQAFQNALPALRTASTDVDRVFHLYENILMLV